MTNKTNTQDYPYLRAFHRAGGSYQYYIEARVREAREANAPQDVVYRTEDGAWVRSTEILFSDLRERIGLPPLPPELNELVRAMYAARDARSTMVTFTRVLPAERFGWTTPIGFGSLTLHSVDMANELQLFYDWAKSYLQGYLEVQRDAQEQDA